MSDLEKLLQITSQVFKLGPRELRSKTRAKDHCRARHVMTYVARTVLCEKMQSIGYAFDRDHTTVLHSYRRVRQNPEAFEPELSQITRAFADVQPVVTPAQEIAFLRRRVIELEQVIDRLRNAPSCHSERLHSAISVRGTSK